MNAEELKLLRLQNQYLLSCGNADKVVSGLVGLQAQYGANALHALHIRTGGGEAEQSRYVKTWTLRGTLHLHAVHDLPLVLYRGSETEFGQMAFTHPDVDTARSERFRALILDALKQGGRTRGELKALCDAKGMTQAESEIVFHAWGGLFRAMAEHGEIAYSSGGNREFVRLEPFKPMEKHAALTELARRYAAHYGPATLRDAQTFFGMPQKAIAPYLAAAATERFTIGSREYYASNMVLATGAAVPPVVFLAGFDPLLLGYRKTENPFLPEGLIKRVYNNTGIVFPTVLLRGRVAAIWKRTPKGVLITQIDKIGVRDKKKIERKADADFTGAAVRWTGETEY